MNRIMNIVSIIDNQFYLSGVNAYWSSMARALEILGHTVHTIGLDSGVHPWNTGLFRSLIVRHCSRRLSLMWSFIITPILGSNSVSTSARTAGKEDGRTCMSVTVTIRTIMTVSGGGEISSPMFCV